MDDDFDEKLDAIWGAIKRHHISMDNCIQTEDCESIERYCKWICEELKRAREVAPDLYPCA
jgi:hypothetical protein